MAAVLRVKRSLNDEPISALIFSCKRRKTDAVNETSVETLFEFAGTVKDPEEDFPLLSQEKVVKSDVKTLSRPAPNLSKKARTASKASSQKNRYKLVNYFRALDKSEQSSCETDNSQTSVTILDVEALRKEDLNAEGLTASTKNLETESKGANYVYDVYRIKQDANVINVDDLLLDGLVSFAPVESELVFESFRNNRADEGNSDSDSPVIDDEDDSNDESNWRNDYPDGEESDEESGLALGFGRITFGDEELSSDEDDERLIYTEELSVSDVNMFGPAYAKFKKRALREMNCCEDSKSDSEESTSTSNSNKCIQDNDIDSQFD